MSWYELLKNEFNWGFVDADSLKYYVGKTISEQDYHSIVGD